MPFGLTNAPASFQGFINKILAEKLDIFIIMYLDNIFIYINDDGNSHVITIQWVLEQLKILLLANLKKCQFHWDKVRFLGYVVSSKSIHIENKKTRQTSSGLSPSQYETTKSFLDLPTFIEHSFRDSTG